MQPRIIPVLQLHNKQLVKTIRFEKPIYVGDPQNTIEMFNSYNADELILNQLTLDGKAPEIDFEYLQFLTSKALVPLSYGGGIRDASDAKQLISIGFEKLVFNTALVDDPDLVRTVAEKFGSQSVVASIDFRKVNGVFQFCASGGSRETAESIENVVNRVLALNPGEILLNNIDADGTRKGYDLEVIGRFTSLTSLPVIASGGAGKYMDLSGPLDNGATASAAGSLFTFFRNRNDQLVNYPDASDRAKILGSQTLDFQELPPLELTTQISPSNKKTDESHVSRTCPKCLIDDSVPKAELGTGSTCYYCKVHEDLDSSYPNGEKGKKPFSEFIQKLKLDGQGSKYDCILGVSGGADSSYLAHILSREGVRVLAVHFDNTWNTGISSRNIHKVLSQLNIDFETIVVDNLEYNDIYKAFLKSGVRDIESPTDIGFMGALYRKAEEHSIKHIVEGHSFRTEGVSPLGWLYMDGRYVRKVHEQFGELPMRTFPNINLFKFVKWAAFSGIERTRPLYWLDYDKASAKTFLSKQFDWKWYGGHHLENKFTAFFHSYFLPVRFNMDYRQIELSALVRSGFLSLAEAKSRFLEPRTISTSLLDTVKDRLGLNSDQFEGLMNQELKTYRDYPTYKNSFIFLRPLFFILLKFNRIPMSFYRKYCFKD